jgi:hypothetical protein
VPNEAYWRDKEKFKESCRKYERTNPRGFLVRVYRNMWSRVVGIQRREAQFYEGLPILPKTAFYLWALGDDSAFWPLWHKWQTTGRERRLVPSVDRIDAAGGYTIDNIQWLTHAQNSGKVRHEFKHRDHPSQRGERHPGARLTNAQAAQVRALYVPSKAWNGSCIDRLAEQFGVKRGVIRGIVEGRTYK